MNLRRTKPPETVFETPAVSGSRGLFEPTLVAIACARASLRVGPVTLRHISDLFIRSGLLSRLPTLLPTLTVSAC